MEKSIAVSVYGGFSRDRLPETGQNGAAYFFRIDTVFWERDISTVPVQQRQSWLMAVSIQHILSKVLRAGLSFIYAGKKRAGRKIFRMQGRKAPACGLPVLPDILCSPSRFAVMSDREPCSGR
ncbi:hypothetical protein NB647_05660 [Oxalobacter aliiformigenes]|uniref:hypothetical protein n=1 Tax=Oxalobacter aliiformigenes TaxID=2946593 RepID=UPI0022AED131|nr:hypothetical protein [Oxalobacter aliiformigenes]WAV88394.1 hypothetical protein NB647_05660 [Oxalobacter aliiformigenes]